MFEFSTRIILGLSCKINETKGSSKSFQDKTLREWVLRATQLTEAGYT